MTNFNDQQIVDSWGENIEPWVSAVRQGEIESRSLITNSAIIDAVIERKPFSILDVGCGEGWLVRELEKHGVSGFGIDVIPELIKSAKKAGGGRFEILSYENLSYAAISKKFDVVVCNFSLLGNESVSHVFEEVPFLLNKGGLFIVQTIHPIVSCGDNEYVDGWREGSWLGFSSNFTNPAPWYFRTMESWKTLFESNGFIVEEMLEPLNKKTQDPASVIFIGAKNNSQEK